MAIQSTPLRTSALKVIVVWLVVAVARPASAEPPGGTPADRRPATVRSVLFKIRDAKSLRRYSVAPLQEMSLRQPEFAGTHPMNPLDPLDPCNLCKPPKMLPRKAEFTFTIPKIDRATWQGLRWYFDLLHPKRGEDRNEVVCSEKELSCEVSDDNRTIAHFRFVKTATGPKLSRIEEEPHSASMKGI